MAILSRFRDEMLQVSSLHFTAMQKACESMDIQTLCDNYSIARNKYALGGCTVMFSVRWRIHCRVQ